MNKNLSICGKTDVGLKRQRNEDSFVIEPDYGLFIVADGMGGHASGDMASGLSIKTVRSFIIKALSDSEITWPFGINHAVPKEINIISSGMRLANKLIFNEAKGMGTTMVVLLIRDNKAYICNIGDSRLYRVRNNMIEQMTEDHSLVADEIKRGAITKEQAKSYSLRHVITRAIGVSADIECDFMVVDIIKGDIFLLCSDGLSGMLEDPEILEIATEKYGLEERCENLIKRANEKGGADNITAILVRCN